MARTFTSRNGVANITLIQGAIAFFEEFPRGEEKQSENIKLCKLN
ncbi:MULTISPECIES: hypothetical protein [unclassified Nostoc]|nr:MULTISPECIES: hypothetical protein [unclassified Nostoc]